MNSIDIAIPNYNYGRYLRECVESVYSQNIAGMRVHLIDNASTDDSHLLIEELSKKYKEMIVSVNARNLGMHSSFNRAIDWSESEYFSLLHADDVLAEGALARAIEFLDANKSVVMCYGDTLKVGSSAAEEKARNEWTVQPGQEFIRERCITAQNALPSTGIVVRTQAQKRAGHYDSRLRLTPDFEMWLRLAAIGDVAHTNAIQGSVRFHETNDSAFTRDRNALVLEQIMLAFSLFFEKQELEGNVTEELRKASNRAIGERAYWSALAHLTRGSFKGSAELLRMALKVRPDYLILPPIGYVFKHKDGPRRILTVMEEGIARWKKV